MSISHIRQCSRCWKLEYKNKEDASLGIRNMTNLTNRDCASINQIANLQNLN